MAMQNTPVIKSFYQQTDTTLRQQAEKALHNRRSESGSQLLEADYLKLIHELEVHQIELEMQNEELIHTRSEAIEYAEKYIDLYDFAPVGYFTISKAGTIIELNLRGCQMLGKERSYLLNNPFGSFCSFETKADFNLFLARIFTTREKESCEVSLLQEDILPMYVHLTGIITGDEDQCHINAIDITERRRADEEIKLKNEKLTKLNAEKDKFFSIIAHDLKSPFSSIIGLTRILADDHSEMKPEEIQEIANSLKESAINVYHLIGNLLEWSRMQRGLIEFKPQTVPLIDVINASIDSLYDMAEQKNQELQILIPANLYVKVDLTMLESTLRNLISNALKFSFRGGKILISARITEDNLVETSVTDYGLGISDAMMSKLFQIDSHTGRNGTEGEPSSGLGLLLCKEFVEKHGGEIWAESNVGKGSTFRFTLPVSIEPDSGTV